MALFERRAANILYNVIAGLNAKGVFILPANVCPIVPLTFIKANVAFEMCDISQETYCLDERQVEFRIRSCPEKYAGVLFARTYGLKQDFERFFVRLKEISPDLLIIDDRCLLPPEFVLSEGTCCDLVIYSSGYAKIVDIGWGGFGFWQGRDRYIRREEPYCPEHLYAQEKNYKMHLSAGTRLRYFDSDWLDLSAPPQSFKEYRAEVEGKLAEALEQKYALNRIYSEGLPREIQLPESYQLWRFNILVPEKENLLDAIVQGGLFASSHYASLGEVFSATRMPVAEALHSRVVNLFNDFHFDFNRARRIVDIISRHLESYPLI